MARQHRPVGRESRIPLFSIFYSTTYTVLYLLTLGLLAITPISAIWSAWEARAYQYIPMIGSAYFLTAVFAIFIYSSRIYTNRSVLAGVGKGYVPVEEGEVGPGVRKMIMRQLERSVVVAWECTPRNVHEEMKQRGGQRTVGNIVPVNPSCPPWGIIEHPGWSSPSRCAENLNPDVQFAEVVAELPNLVEAKAVSLATTGGETDPAMVDVLRRPRGISVRDYLLRLHQLGLVEQGHDFLPQYEHARFCARPISQEEFASLMDSFSRLLAGISSPSHNIITQLREHGTGRRVISKATSSISRRSVSAARSATPRIPSTETLIRPPPPLSMPSVESFDSVIRRPPDDDTASLASSLSAAGSIIHRR